MGTAFNRVSREWRNRPFSPTGLPRPGLCKVGEGRTEDARIVGTPEVCELQPVPGDAVVADESEGTAGRLGCSRLPAELPTRHAGLRARRGCGSSRCGDSEPPGQAHQGRCRKARE
jgi:hypothetical protein